MSPLAGHHIPRLEGVVVWKLGMILNMPQAGRRVSRQVRPGAATGMASE